MSKRKQKDWTDKWEQGQSVWCWDRWGRYWFTKETPWTLAKLCDCGNKAKRSALTGVVTSIS